VTNTSLDEKFDEKKTCHPLLMVQLTTKLLLQLYLQLYINDEMTCGIFVIAIQNVHLLIYWLVGRLGS